MFTEADQLWMQQALTLAAQGLYTTTPNPRVGCVIVRDGEKIGSGWHARAGEPHAEVLALREAGPRAVGATAYVTLEPCNHFGRTPPCVDALIEARVARVIVAMVDPNPQVAGQGLQRLQHAGIEVRCGLLQQEARELNLGFISRMLRQRPWVRSKIAMTLDGKIAMSNGHSQWITQEAARTDGQAWRARACALLTGSGTVHADDPQLNVRAVPTTRQPIKVVVDGLLRLSPQAKIFSGAPVWVATSLMPEQLASESAGLAAALTAKGAQLLHIPMQPDQRMDLTALLHTLAERGINELHVEAGTGLNTALLQAGLLDELLLYIAPGWLGVGRSALECPALPTLANMLRWQVIDTATIGTDVRLLLRHPRSAEWLNH